MELSNIWRLQNIVFSTKILVGNTLELRKFVFLMNFILLKYFLVSERGSPTCIAYMSISLHNCRYNVPRSTKASEKIQSKDVS